MYMLGMTKQTRQHLFSQNVENTPGDDQFSPENPWESSFQGIDTPSNEFYNVSSTTGHYPGSPGPKIFLKCDLLPQINPLTP